MQKNISTYCIPVLALAFSIAALKLKEGGASLGANNSVQCACSDSEESGLNRGMPLSAGCFSFIVQSVRWGFVLFMLSAVKDLAVLSDESETQNQLLFGW